MPVATHKIGYFPFSLAFLMVFRTTEMRDEIDRYLTEDISPNIVTYLVKRDEIVLL